MSDIEVKHPIMQFTVDEVQAILAQYNRTLTSAQVDEELIQKWILSQPHLTQMPSKRLILSMLIKNKFSIEKTKTKLDYYYSLRSMIPEVFKNRLPIDKDIVQMRRMSRAFVLPKLVNLNRVVFFVLDEMDFTFEPYTNLAKTCMDVEAILYNDLSSSLEVIWDCSKSNFAFWSSFTPMMGKISVNISEKLFSNRASAIRIIGLPSVAQVFVNAALACLPEKIRNRVTTHSDAKDMLKYYPKDLLPSEYGGEAGGYHPMSVQFEDMMDKSTEYFRNIQNYEVDERLRPKKLDNDELLGFHGNFRKLEVD